MKAKDNNSKVVVKDCSKVLLIAITTLTVLLINIVQVSALGVSSPYWKDNPLKLSPGETRDIEFTLVNREDSETTKAFVELSDNGGISEITSGTEYDVQPGSTESKVVLRISIPETASIGQSYNVKFSVRSAPEGEGTVQLAVAYNVEFPVQVVNPGDETPLPRANVPQAVAEESNAKLVWFVVVLLIVIILLVLGVIYLLLGKR